MAPGLTSPSASQVGVCAEWPEWPIHLSPAARCKTLPAKPKHGIVIAPKTDHGMRALFRCRDGYKLRGPNITWCHLGQWNVSSPQCEQGEWSGVALT